MVRVIIPDDPAPAAEGVMSGACLWLLITAGDCRRFFGVAERRFCGVMPPKGLAALAAAACCCAAWAWKIVPNHILCSLAQYHTIFKQYILPLQVFIFIIIIFRIS